jgi:hypothetical protein
VHTGISDTCVIFGTARGVEKATGYTSATLPNMDTIFSVARGSGEGTGPACWQPRHGVLGVVCRSGEGAGLHARRP